MRIKSYIQQPTMVVYSKEDLSRITVSFRCMSCKDNIETHMLLSELHGEDNNDANWPYCFECFQDKKIISMDVWAKLDENKK